MAMAMNLSPLANRATRLQLARVRAAMCNALPGRFAKPRRLSAAFLAAEIQELAMYRTDARRTMRGLELVKAVDPTTDAPLHPNWWSRYCCPPPESPSHESPVFVRSTAPPPSSASPKFDPSDASKPRSSTNLSEAAPDSGGKRNDMDSTLIPPRTPNSLEGSRLYIRPAVYLSLQGENQIAIRFTDDNSQQIVSDLDVMLPHITQPGTPAGPRQPCAEQSPLSSRLTFSPQQLFDPLFVETPRFGDGMSGLTQLYSSPFRAFHSPLQAIRPASSSTVECELDVRHLAESMRLLDRKTDLLYHFRSLNDSVEAAQQQNVPLPGSPQHEAVQCRYDSLIRELAFIDDDLRQVFVAEMPIQPIRDNVVNSLNFNSPEPPGTLAEQAPPSGAVTPEGKAVVGTTLNPRNAQSDRNLSLIESGDTAMSAPPVPSSSSLLTFSIEHLSKDIDFQSAAGAVTFAKALTRAVLAQLTEDNVLKTAPNSLRADLMDCVSACVTVLLRARSTKDYRCIEEIVDTIPVRFHGNVEALEAIHTAAREFESGSTDSL